MGTDTETAGASNQAEPRWTGFLRTVAAVALVGVGAWHIVEGFRTLSAPDARHVVGGAALVAIGLLGLLRHASRWRKSVAVAVAVAPTNPAPHDASAPLRLPPSKGATTRALFGATLICALSIVVMVLPWLEVDAHGQASHPLAFSLVGLVGLLFFGTCLIWIAQRRLDGSDALIADRLGLYDRSNALSDDERVPWRAISGFRAVSFGGQRFVAVDLVDPGKFIARAHGLRRLARSINRRLVGSPWCIAPRLLGWDATALAERLEARRAHQLESR